MTRRAVESGSPLDRSCPAGAVSFPYEGLAMSRSLGPGPVLLYEAMTLRRWQGYALRAS